MKQKVIITMLAVTFAVAAFIIVTSPNAEGRRPVAYELQRKVDLDDRAIKDMLGAGWSLGGVYQDCGEGANDVVITLNIDSSLLPFYKQLLERNRQDMLKLLGKQFSGAKAEEIVKKISAGKDKLSNYGNVGDYKTLQEEYDRIQQILAGIEEAPAAENVANIDNLVKELEKFAKGGTIADINNAKKAIVAIEMILEKDPGQFLASNVGVIENVDRLENIREVIKNSLGRIEQLGGSGCRMTYVFYKPKK